MNRSDIEINISSKESRVGKSVIARAIKNALEDCGYLVEWKFSESSKYAFREEELKKLYSSKKAIHTFDELKKLKNPRADIILTMDRA